MSELWKIIFPIIYGVLVIGYFYYGIQNRKDKKILLWLLLPTIYFIKNILGNFDIKLVEDELLNKCYGIILAIAFIIAFFIEIRNNKSKKKIILYSLASIFSIGMFFIYNHQYNSTRWHECFWCVIGGNVNIEIVWTIIANIIIMIYSNKKIDDSSKVRKIINVILSSLIIISFITVSTEYILAITKIIKTNSEMEKFISQLKSALTNEKESNDTLILVKRDNKWGCINSKGQEIIPCEYDAISPSTTQYKIFQERI